jgi:hypothetical protein
VSCLKQSIGHEGKACIPDFARGARPLEDLDDGVHAVAGLEDAQGGRGVDEDAEQGVEDDGRERQWRTGGGLHGRAREVRGCKWRRGEVAG